MPFDYFTQAELDALPNMSEGRYTTALKMAAAEWAVAVIERTVGTSFILRTVTDEEHDGGATFVILREPFAKTITSATEDGVPVTDSMRIRSGVMRRYGSQYDTTPVRWYGGVLKVTYQAGYTATPPADIKQATLQAARWYLLGNASNTDLNARQTAITSDMGGTIQFSTAGPDRPTGYPNVDAVIIGWRDRLMISKSAV